MYKVIVDHSAEKDLENLPNNIIRKILKALEKLGLNPRPVGVKKLNVVDENLYRVRLGDYRIIYAVGDELRIVNVRRIRHRKDVYRNL